MGKKLSKKRIKEIAVSLLLLKLWSEKGFVAKTLRQIVVSKRNDPHMGELALHFLDKELEEYGRPVPGDRLQRKLASLSVETGIPVEELEQFTKIMLTRTKSVR